MRFSLSLAEAAFDYGRNIGIAFQLVDDILDFEARQEENDQVQLIFMICTKIASKIQGDPSEW